jgi:hypothetical protein
MPRRIDLFLIVAITLAVNLTYLVASNGDFYFPDSRTYLAPARHLLHGDGFVTDIDVPETIRTPVYPLLLLPFVAVTASPIPIVVLQHLLNAILAAAIYLFVLRRGGSRFAAVAAAMLFALDTPTIHYANKVLSETAFTLLLFVCFLLALNLRRFAVNGLLCGVLVLLRPVAILWFAALALYYLLRGVSWRRVAGFAAIALVLPLLWTVRNGLETGVYVLSSISGTNLLFYRAAGALSVDEGDDFRRGLAAAQKELQAEADQRIRAGEETDDPRSLDHAVQAKYYSELAVETIRQNKLAFLQVTIRGLLVNLSDSDWESMMMVCRADSSIVRMLLDFWTAAVILLAGIGLFVLWRYDRPLALLLAFTILYFVGISAGGESEARFRVPVTPQLAIAAAVALDRVRRSARISPASTMRTPSGGESTASASTRSTSLSFTG